MTLGTQQGSLREERANAAAVVGAFAGCLALAARPPLPWAWLGVTVAVGVAGACASAAPDRRSKPSVTFAVTLIAIVAFGSVRLSIAVAPARGTATTAVLVVIAAVAEELFFRRFLYGTLARWGAAAAVVGSALAFAAAHVPAYGTAVFPIDLAAGLVLSWQRWATGSWASCAASHAAANLMAIL